MISGQEEGNKDAGHYKIQCTVYDGTDPSDPQIFTLDIEPNTPPTKEAGANIDDDYEIDIQDTTQTVSYTVPKDITSLCGDVENDQITYSVYFNDLEVGSI